MILKDESTCYAHPIVKPKRSVFIRIFECVYERCAGYNLRYCPIRGFRTKNCMNEALRDILLLTCFLLANFIVFLTIFARMTMHLSAVLVQSAGWLKRSILPKIIQKEDILAGTSQATQQTLSFTTSKDILNSQIH